MELDAHPLGYMHPHLQYALALTVSYLQHVLPLNSPMLSEVWDGFILKCFICDHHSTTLALLLTSLHTSNSTTSIHVKFLYNRHLRMASKLEYYELSSEKQELLKQCFSLPTQPILAVYQKRPEPSELRTKITGTPFCLLPVRIRLI